MLPIEIACSYSGKPNGITLFVCGAQANEPCRDVNNKPLSSSVPFHAERIIDAQRMTLADSPVSLALFDKAVEDSKLV